METMARGETWLDEGFVLPLGLKLQNAAMRYEIETQPDGSRKIVMAWFVDKESGQMWEANVPTLENCHKANP